MKRNFRFGTVAAESYLCPAPDTTNLPTKQPREEMTMFAPSAFAPQAGVEVLVSGATVSLLTFFRLPHIPVRLLPAPLRLPAAVQRPCDRALRAEQLRRA